VIREFLPERSLVERDHAPDVDAAQRMWLW
jgi:hypothetical protein